MDSNNCTWTPNNGSKIMQSNAMDANPLVCKYCDKTFMNKKSIQQHYKRTHHVNVNKKIVEDIKYKSTLKMVHDGTKVYEFECNLCDKKYSKKKSMQWHSYNSHNDNIKCTICNKFFASKRNLLNHNKFINCSNQNELSIGNQVIRDEEQNESVQRKKELSIANQVLRDEEQNKTLPKCEICQKQFLHNKSLISHKEKIHLISRAKRKPIICPMESCTKAFITFLQLRIHLKKQDDAGGHNMEMEEIEENFNNIQEFQEWKEELELKQNISFIYKGRHTRKDGGFSKWYQCYRSGKYRFTGKGKRKTKTQGTCKIGSCCPAGMKIICSSDGTVKCIYNITHAGHGLNGPNNVYVPIHKKYKQFILEKCLLGIPADRIHKELIEQGGGARYIKLTVVKNHMKKLSKAEPKIVCDFMRGRKKIKRSFYERCEKAKELSVDVKSVGKFKVSSQVGESHEVTWLQSCECINDCSNCGVCMHMFECDCEDYSNENVCKHIHSVGYFNDVCEKAKELAVEKISADRYKVSSRSNENHEVVLFQLCSCLMKCRCGICKHLYKCNCTDNSKGMCKHVHAIGHFNNDSLNKFFPNIVKNEAQMFEGDVMPVKSNRIPTSDEYIEDEEQILRQNCMPEMREREQIIKKINARLIELQNNLKTDSNNSNVPIEHFKEINEKLKETQTIKRSLSKSNEKPVILYINDTI